MLCSVQRLFADVLAHPHKEPLMSALPTKDRGTNKDSIVIRLIQCHPKKQLLEQGLQAKKQSPTDSIVSNNLMLQLKWYLMFHKCHHMVSILSFRLFSSPV